MMMYEPYHMVHKMECSREPGIPAKNILTRLYKKTMELWASQSKCENWQIGQTVSMDGHQTVYDDQSSFCIFIKQKQYDWQMSVVLYMGKH